MVTIVLAAVALVASSIAVMRAVRRDGYGITPPPRSHVVDPWAESRLP
jgi:hypothetical protein